MKVRDLIALVLAMAAFAGLAWMWSSETHVMMPGPNNSIDVAQYFQSVVLPSLQRYSFGIGLTMFLVSLAFILLGHEDKVSTTADDIEK